MTWKNESYLGNRKGHRFNDSDTPVSIKIMSFNIKTYYNVVGSFLYL